MLPTVTAKNVSRHCQVSPGDQLPPVEPAQKGGTGCLVGRPLQKGKAGLESPQISHVCCLSSLCAVHWAVRPTALGRGPGAVAEPGGSYLGALFFPLSINRRAGGARLSCERLHYSGIVVDGVVYRSY